MPNTLGYSLNPLHYPPSKHARGIFLLNTYELSFGPMAYTLPAGILVVFLIWAPRRCASSVPFGVRFAPCYRTSAYGAALQAPGAEPHQLTTRARHVKGSRASGWCRRHRAISEPGTRRPRATRGDAPQKSKNKTR